MSYDVSNELILAKERLLAYQAAELKILRNQEYTIKDRTFTKADLKVVKEEILRLQMQVQRLTDGGIKSSLAIPRNY